MASAWRLHGGFELPLRLHGFSTLNQNHHGVAILSPWRLYGGFDYPWPLHGPPMVPPWRVACAMLGPWRAHGVSMADPMHYGVSI